MKISNTSRKIIGTFLLSGVFFLTLIGIPRAQTVTSQPNLGFKLVAFDALSKGTVSSSTKQVLFALQLTNNTSNIETINLVVKTISTGNYPTGGTDQFSGPFLGHSPQIQPFSTYLIYLQNQSNPLILNNTVTSASITATVSFTVQVAGSGIAPVTQNFDEVIFQPSNNDLIPTILTNLTNISNSIQSLYTQLTSLQTGQSQIYNEETQLQSGISGVYNEETQLQTGISSVYNEDTQLQTGESYIENQESQIEGLLTNQAH